MRIQPVTRAQARLLLRHAVDPAHTARMTIACGWEFRRTAFDVSVLAAALRQTVGRHDVLRATFAVEPEPHAIVHDELDVTPEVRAFGTRDEASAWIADCADQSFDIATAPLMRCHVAVAGDTVMLAVVTHHLLCDGRAFEILIDELGTVDTDQDHPASQFYDIARAEASALADPVAAAYVRRRQAELAGLEPLDLPIDFPRPMQPSGYGAVGRTRLPDVVGDRLGELARTGLTPVVVGLAVFGVLLARYTGSTDIAVGVPVANRSWPGSWDAVGYLANTAVVRLHIDEAKSFETLVRRCRSQVLDTIDYSHVPLDEVVAAVRPDRSGGINPLYQVTFAGNTLKPALIAGALGTPLRLDRDIQVLDISVTLVRAESGYEVVWNYDTDLFEAGTADAMVRTYSTLLEQLTAAPYAAVRSASGVHPHDAAMLATWSGFDRLAAPTTTTVVQDFRRAASERPNATAIVEGELRLTYAELDRWSDAVASTLAERGVGPGDIVGVGESRSHRFPVAALGVMKSGAAYLPLDPAYPAALLHLMVRDAGARCGQHGDPQRRHDLA
ncbi:MAG: AMP-binding protein [Streptomyces sp.]|uniref:condensation domain-containing protein n=1 Tax=Streptomyces sp. TaxID=1931 RepID=UPI0025D08DE5|nr:condensation domain-containing protein [Streptomyces sp.]MBW8799879.1 AMP-binding protein [Streptomyces sp.]